MVSNKYSLDEQYVGGGKAAIPPQPPMSKLDSSVSSLREVSDRLSGLANQLSGIEPEKDESRGIGLSGGGIFGSIERHAIEIDELVGIMARHLSRIERRL